MADSTVWPENQAHSAELEVTEDLKINIWGYRTNSGRNLLCTISYFFTLGFLRLLFYWYPEWHANSTCDKSPLNCADFILIKDEHHTTFLREVKFKKSAEGFTILLKSGEITDVNVLRYFTLRKVTFIWYPQLNVFHRVFDYDESVPSSIVHQCRPLSDKEVRRRTNVYGPNEIAVNLTPIHMLLFKEVLNPFYLFQVFSVCVWYSENYFIYASIIILISALSIVVNIYQIRKNQKTLHDMMYSVDVVQVIRESNLKPDAVSSTQLVVGDIIAIPQNGCTMECDAVLISGDCVVNESMLTGESVPITKTPFPDEPDLLFDTKNQGKHTLFCGTKVLLTRQKPGSVVRAVVVRTGYNTSKGRLVCSILYPKPVDFAFTKDLLLFVAVLLIVAAIGFLYTLILMGMRGYGAGKIILKALDIVTIVVPPFLPAAMTIGIIAAESRLKNAQIFCISPSTINTCGAITCVCFDKTGTLTEDGLDLMGVLPAEKIQADATMLDVGDLLQEDHFVAAMACCHSLTLINNELAGDPMDLILFNQSGWQLEESTIPSKDGKEDWMGVIIKTNDARTTLKCLKQFTFSSQLRRMSVIVENAVNEKRWIYCKGAPETIAELCLSETVPADFSDVLNYYAKHGYRVLGLSSKELEGLRSADLKETRESLERDMRFLGLVVFENRLKPQTTAVISELKEARIRTVMITGDNLLTAISVAKECGVLDRVKPTYILEATQESEGSVHLRIQPTSDDRPLSSGFKKLSLAKNGFSFDLERGFSHSDIDKANYQLAIEGTSLRLITQMYPHNLHKLISVCSVFARMSPEQKVQVVGGFQEIDYVVAMCGDGANDCGALKAAHAGISLSEAEASIASPFTSKNANITCVSTVIREGRAALVTSFGIFKYMVCYSMTQFLSVVMLYWIGSNLGDYQFLYIDLFITTTFMVFFGYTAACSELAKKPPPVRLLSFASIWSISLQLLLVLGVQVFVYEIVSFQPWFVPFVDPGDETNYYSYQGTGLFVVSLYQYISLMLVFSKAHPYRRSIFSNIYLTISLVVCTSVSIWMSLQPTVFESVLNMKLAPNMQFRVFLLFVAAFDVALALFLEYFFIDFAYHSVMEPKGYCTGKKRAKYVDLIETVGQDPSSLIKS